MKVKITCLALLLLSSFPAALYSAPLRFPCTEKNAVRVIDENNYKLIICSFGGPITENDDGWEHASGIAFYKVSKTENILLHQSDEFREGIDFKYEKRILHIRTYTFQYPDFDNGVPFLEEEIDLSGKAIKRKYTILLRSAKPGQREIVQHIGYLNKYRHTGSKSLDKAYKALYALRNYSLYETNYVFKYFKWLGENSKFDGELAETFSSLKEEVELIRKAKRKPQ